MEKREKERLRRRVEGCIMTPMPNHLSTYLSLPLNHKTTQNSVEGKKSGAVWER